MLQVVKQTREEKIAMYRRMKKKDLAEMLANRDMLDEHRSPSPFYRHNTAWSEGQRSGNISVSNG